MAAVVPPRFDFAALMPSVAEVRHGIHEVGRVIHDDIARFRGYVYDIATRLRDFIWNNRDLLFFVVATFFAASSFPRLFVIGIPMGMVGGFLVAQTCKSVEVLPGYYMCRDGQHDGATAMATLGALNMIGKGVVELNNGRFSIGQEGVISSLCAGILAGAYMHSSLSLSYETVKARFFA